jgi:5,10-methylenetetrahydromethanopterin reductase
MKVEFGVSLGQHPHLLGPKDAEQFLGLARQADRYDVAAISTYDTSFLGGDAFTRATLMAIGSTRVRIGIRPTNPITREPQIMAAFLASLDAMSGGRAFIEMASGDSSVRNIGYKAASRAQIEEYICCVRDLLATGTGTYRGRVQSVHWHNEARRPRVPIALCAEGPKMLHLGGRIADSVTAGIGLTPNLVVEANERVAAGARADGRDPSDVHVWFATRAALDEDDKRAKKSVKASVSSILHHAMHTGLDDKLPPGDLRDRVRSYVDGYVLDAHTVDEGINARRMEELGLLDFAMSRWSLAGDPDAWIRRIRELAQAGATRLWVGFAAGDLASQYRAMDLFGTEVLPHFS